MLALKGYDSKMGARPLSRKIDELIRVPLSKKILFEQLRDVTVTADLVNNEVQFDPQPITSGSHVDENGFIKLGDAN
jgi:ATP-dependent Clp protease ATP-binding subunit ClpA